MTSRNGQMPGVRPGEPVVLAPRAVRVTNEGGSTRLAQGALGLGAPGLAQNGDVDSPPVPPGPTGGADLPEAVADPYSKRDSGESRRPPVVSPPAPTSPSGRPRPSFPSSPADQDGIYRGLLWVAWAIEECSRAFTRLSSRLTGVERRLERLEAAETQQPASPPAPSGDDSRLERLEARVAESHSQASGRLDALEERLRQLDFLPLKLTNLQRSVDQLGSAQQRATAMGIHRAGPVGGPAGPSDRQLHELQRELAAAQRRLAVLEAKTTERPPAASARTPVVDEERLVATVEDVVRRHAERLAAQAPAPGDLEGVYRELDAVAEFVAARSAAAVEGLERIAPLEAAVLELRRDLVGAVGGTNIACATGCTDGRLDELDDRVRRLELSSRKAGRLFAALATAVQVRQPEDGSYSPPEMSRNGTAATAPAAPRGPSTP